MRYRDILRNFTCNLTVAMVFLWSWQAAGAQSKNSQKSLSFGDRSLVSMKSAKPTSDSDNWVEIEFPATELVPYKERRPTHQLSFGFQYEPTVFKNYASVIDSQTYETLFGKSSTDLIEVSLGWKVNLPVVGIDLQGIYGRGAMSDTRSGQNVGIALNKKGLRVLAVIDGIFDENYIVPYLGVQYVEWDLSTFNDVASASLTTGPCMGMTAGLLIPLSWLERDSALRSYNDGGLNNTYLDVFVNQYQKPGNAGDPDLSGLTYGAGLKLEF